MYYTFPAQTSFSVFLQKIASCDQHVMVMFTFHGCATTLLSKKRYLQTRLHEQVPLFVVDVRRSPQLFHELQTHFPELFASGKLPVHVCFAQKKNTQTGRLTLRPLLRNSALLGDRHFNQIRTLSIQSSLENASTIRT